MNKINSIHEINAILTRLPFLRLTFWNINSIVVELKFILNWISVPLSAKTWKKNYHFPSRLIRYFRNIDHIFRSNPILWRNSFTIYSVWRSKSSKCLNRNYDELMRRRQLRIVIDVLHRNNRQSFKEKSG